VGRGGEMEGENKRALNYNNSQVYNLQTPERLNLARVCWPLLCLCRPFCIFERCLDSNPESCCSKQHYGSLLNFQVPEYKDVPI
jgi:hypothetical protein